MSGQKLDTCVTMNVNVAMKWRGMEGEELRDLWVGYKEEAMTVSDDSHSLWLKMKIGEAEATRKLGTREKYKYQLETNTNLYDDIMFVVYVCVCVSLRVRVYMCVFICRYDIVCMYFYNEKTHLLLCIPMIAKSSLRQFIY